MQLMYVSAPTGYTKPLNEVHAEYPKFVNFSDGRQAVIVNDAEEEEAAKGGAVIAPKPLAALPRPAPINNLTGMNDEEAMLRKIAADKNIYLDGRWKLPRIRKAVEAISS